MCFICHNPKRRCSITIQHHCVLQYLRKLQNIKFRNPHSRLLKCSLSEHFQAVPDEEVTKLKSPMFLITRGMQLTGQTDLDLLC